MSRDKPVVRAIKLLTLIERNGNGKGLRVTDVAEQLDANARAIYRDLQFLEELRIPLNSDKNGRESYWRF
jgi:DNA-binding IclR family transcriptional regulator